MLGIDVSQTTLADSLLAADSQHLLAAGSVPNTPAGISQLLAQIPADQPWVVEPTGAYSRPLVRQAHAEGRTVLLAPPKAAKAFLQAVSPRAKTDRLDSQGLARYALAMPLRPYPLPSETVEQLEQLLAARRGLSQSRARLRQQQAALPLAAEALTGAVTALTAELTALDRQITALTRHEELAVVQELVRIPGVGPVTAATVAACLATRPFSHADQFVAYCGLDVRVRDSGQHRGQRRLSRHGDGELRRLFYLGAQANLRSRDPHNPFKHQYQRERAKGLSSTAALVAVARKLARTCWSLVTHGTRYDPARVHQQPLARSPQPARALDSQP